MRIYRKLLALHMKSAMTYRGSFFFSCLGQLLITVNTFLGVWFLLDRFDTIGGYTLPQLSLGFAVVIFGYAVADCFARGFDRFAQYIADGTFDRMLVRPRGLIFQVLCQELKPHGLSRLLQVGALLWYAVTAGEVEWTAGRIATLALMMVCCAAIFSGLFLLSAAICFFTLEQVETINIFTNGTLEYGKYPFAVYGKGVLWIVTFLVPFALVQYWPMEYLFGRGPWWYGALPAAALWFLLPCLWLWDLGLRHYQSTGS